MSTIFCMGSLALRCLYDQIHCVTNHDPLFPKRRDCTAELPLVLTETHAEVDITAVAIDGHPN